jgi:hypothetical protein
MTRVMKIVKNQSMACLSTSSNSKVNTNLFIFDIFAVLQKFIVKVL